MKSFNLLGVRIDLCEADLLKKNIENILDGDQFCQLSTVNPEFLVEASKNEKFKKILNQNTLNICDGVGISLLAKLFYKTSVPRIPGVSVAEIFCEIAAQKGKSVFFLGGFKVADIAAKSMQKKYPDLNIAGTLDGDMDSFSEIEKTKPDVILVAFGAPKQESWLAQNGARIPSLRLGAGFGGTFDFWAGKIKRAPKIFQTLGLEWLFRLLCEPLKRGPRIFKAVCVFPFLVVKEKLQSL